MRHFTQKVLLFTLSGAIAIGMAACTVNVATPGAATPTDSAATAPLTSTNGITDTGAISPVTPVTITISVTPTVTPVPAPTVTTPVVITPTVTAPVTITPTTVITPAAPAITTTGALTDVFGTIATLDSLATLNSALLSTGLVDELDVVTRSLTIFAPTNEAFAALPAGVMDGLLADPATLADVLRYHVVVDTVTSADLIGFGAALTALGPTVTVTTTADGAVTVNNATVLQADIPATNGLIHIIDTVLLPPGLVTSTIALTAPVPLSATVSVTPTGGITATNGVTNAQIITADVTALTVAQVISTTAGFRTLATAVQAAGLTGALGGVGPITVFAPTDEAFANLPTGTLETLLNSPTDLVNVLQYHVVADQVLAADLARLGVALSILGQSVTVTVGANGTVTINDATIVQRDIQAANGVIHVIDAVLIPAAQ